MSELRVWASHLAGQRLTILHREVPFDSAGRSAGLTQEEFDRAMSIPCFASDGPVPSSRDFLPAAYTLTDWLCCVGISPVLVASLTEDQREVLAFDLRGMGEPFNMSHEQFAARMGAQNPPPVVPSVLDGNWEAHGEAEEEQALPQEGEVPEAVEPLDLGAFMQEVLAEVAAWGGDGFQHPDEEEQALPHDGEAAEDEDEAFEMVDAGTDEVLAEVGGFQHPNAAALLGAGEQEEAPAGDMLSQFDELTAEARAEFVLGGDLAREQLDTLFNVEAQGRKSKKVLSAITTALQRFPNKDAYSINQALVTASAGPRQIEE